MFLLLLLYNKTVIETKNMMSGVFKL